MGEKGDKLSSVSTKSADFLLEKLAAIEGITAKKMFGGHGVFHDKRMFGIVSPKGEIFFKAQADLQLEYEEKGATKHSRMPYYSVPENILEDDVLLNKWALKSIAIL